MSNCWTQSKMSDKIIICLYSFTIIMNEFWWWKAITATKISSSSHSKSLFPFMIGFLIVFIIFSCSYAQQENHWNTISATIKQELNSITLEREMKSWEQEQIIEKSIELTKSRYTTKWNSDEKNWHTSMRKEMPRSNSIENEVWKLVVPRWFPKDSIATQIATYERKVSNWNKAFLLKLKTENWWYDMFKQSEVRDRNWPNGREDSRGLCQFHRNRHSEIVDDPRFWTDYKFQVEKCREKFSWWTTFYWKSEWLRFEDYFTIVDK